MAGKLSLCRIGSKQGIVNINTLKFNVIEPLAGKTVYLMIFLGYCGHIFECICFILPTNKCF